MKIAVDARELTGRPTGVGRYLSELTRCWADSADAGRHEWTLYVHIPATALMPGPFASSVRVLPGSGGTRWEQWSLARALAQSRPDVLFAPGYTAPLTAPCPIALTVHDVSFFAHPEWFAAREGVRRRSLTAWSARRARLVLTDSWFSRDEIVGHIGIPADKVRVVPLGMTRPTTAERREREPLILFVGSIFQRRHVDRLIRVFAELVMRCVPGSRLAIVGENRTHPARDLATLLESYPQEVQNRVAILSYVESAALAALYARARVFAFLSEYEGFGLTPLEALAAGVPAVVLDTPIAREVYGPAARYVRDLSDSAALADALVALLTDPAAREAILAHAGEVLGRYDWSRTATATLGAIEDAAGA